MTSRGRSFGRTVRRENKDTKDRHREKGGPDDPNIWQRKLMTKRRKTKTEIHLGGTTRRCKDTEIQRYAERKRRQGQRLS